MLRTRMSGFAWLCAALTLAGLLSGCTGTSRSWWSRSRETVQATTLPIVPAPQEYQAYADGAAQPRFEQYAGTRESCSSGSCCSKGGGCSSGSSCSSGSCRTNLAAGPPTAQANPSYGNVMVQTQPAQQGSSTMAPGKYGGQRTCPVTDEELGSMGPPAPVSVRGQTIYVCCEGCAEAVQADPDQYLAKVMRERVGQ